MTGRPSQMERLRDELARYVVTPGTGKPTGVFRPLQIVLCRMPVVLAAVAALTIPSVAEAQGSQAGAVSDESRLAAPLSGTAAVLPFTNVSGDPADDWLGAGIAETVAVDLKNHGLSAIYRVPSRSVDPASASDRRLVDVGREVGATWVVAGGYQRLGDMLRITARLVDVSSGAVIRSVKLDGMLSDIFELQDRIVVGLSSDGEPLRADNDRPATASPGTRVGGRPATERSTSDADRTTSVQRSEGLVVSQPNASTPQVAPLAGGGLTPTDVTGSVTLGGTGTSTTIPGSTTAAGFGPAGSGPRVVPARVVEPPTIDGRLDDAAWQGAVRITDFVQMNPLEGAPASEETEVYLAYDNNTFYVGVRAHYSDVALIRANRVERDQTVRDDKLTLYFDPFMDQQRAYVFSVNGYGVQGDATLDLGGSGGGRRRQGGGGGGPGGGPPGVIPAGDTSWDALFSSAGGLVEDGWTAEMAIPFKSLRYPARGGSDVHRWGFQIVRNIESKDERAVWSPVSRGVQGFLPQMGTLDGMTGLSTSRNLELLPTVTAIRAGSVNTGTGDFVNDDFSPEAGLNVKYGITSNLTADFTVNPDFSQIESDQPQIEVNQRFPLFFSELRPFFLEGQEIFRIFAPINYVHTRTIVDPRVGGKLTGKVGQSTLGVLIANDEAPGKRDDPTDPAFGQTAQFLIGRYRYDLYGESHLGAFVSDREFMDSYSRVVGVDSQLRIGGTDRFNLVVSQSQSRGEDGTERLGPAGGVLYRRNGRNLSFSALAWVTDPDFRNGVGFVRRTDEKRGNFTGAYRWWPESWLISWGPRASYLRNYDFDGILQDEVAGGGLDFAFARSITASVGADRALERFGGSISRSGIIRPAST